MKWVKLNTVFVFTSVVRSHTQLKPTLATNTSCAILPAHESRYKLFTTLLHAHRFNVWDLADRFSVEYSFSEPCRFIEISLVRFGRHLSPSQPSVVPVRIHVSLFFVCVSVPLIVCLRPHPRPSCVAALVQLRSFSLPPLPVQKKSSSCLCLTPSPSPALWTQTVCPRCPSPVLFLSVVLPGVGLFERGWARWDRLAPPQVPAAPMLQAQALKAL